MKANVYAYRDSKNEGHFSMPLCDFSDQMAQRHFGMQVTATGSEMNYAPGDFDLYKIGTYDYDNGKLESCLPEFICNGVNVV